MIKLKIREVLLLVLYTVPNSLLTLCIIYIISSVYTHNAVMFKGRLGIIFFAVTIASYLLDILFQRKIIGFTNDLIYDNEVKILDTVRKAQLMDLEKMGKDRIYAILEDLRSLVFIPYVITKGVNSILILTVGLSYFFYISYKAALTFLLLMVVFLIVYFIRNKNIQQKGAFSRSLNDKYFRLIRDQLEGFKELKLNKVKQTNLFEKYLIPNRHQAKETEVEVAKSFLALNLLGQYGLFLIIGTVMFIFPYLNIISKEQMLSFIVIILFISTPINTLVSLQTFFFKISVSSKRIRSFTKELHREYTLRPDAHPLIPKKTFNKICFENVLYRYENSSFKLDAFNLEINKGEVVFIIGGNGSGKSTFINLLSNLYHSSSGKLLVDGRQVEEDDEDYRSLISPIFTDHHLFSENYDNAVLTGNAEYTQLLELMQLDGIVTDDKDASARRRFSKGQGKRMALIFALLEKRPILILDEWAADQDPYFRKYFYEKLIPELKKQNKTIIAVTHDDAYFKQADRIIKFDYGRIVKDVRITDDVSELENIWVA